MIRRILCAIRGHGGIGNDSRCKRCNALVDCRPKNWRHVHPDLWKKESK